jgi:hypothetical protein
VRRSHFVVNIDQARGRARSPHTTGSVS